MPDVPFLTCGLGLGCAELYQEPSASRRRRVLEVAFASGIRHVDVAPMYGLGLAEPEIGRFARTRRGELVIATKFGITPSTIGRTLATVQGPVRRLYNRFPALRQQARRRASGPASGRSGRLLYRATGFDGNAVRDSLQHSLRELATDYIDVFLLHDPHPGDVRSDDMCAALEDANRAGYIRAWGLAGEPEPTVEIARRIAVAPPVLQVRDNLLDRDSTSVQFPPGPFRITFGVLGRSLGAIVAHVRVDATRRKAWHDAVGGDCGDPDFVAPLLLRQAARDNPEGVVLFGTTNADHVLSTTAAISAVHPGEDADLETFVRLVDSELRVEPGGVEHA